MAGVDTAPYWDARMERWYQLIHHSAHETERREVPNPRNGVYRQPPAGVTTRPKRRSSRGRP